MPETDPPPALVSLVGAGPGDLGLLTLRGRDRLRSADLVLYDGLVNAEMLRLASGRVERTARVVKDGDRRVDQTEVNRRLIDAARSGLRVCRLKGGDPYIFGRGSEEAAALREAGIPFEVVPGVTAATASGAYAGFSLTHRDIASAVALVTGHERPGKPSSTLDYDALAAFPGTLVFYMGSHRAGEIAEKLIACGKSAATPAAVVSKASLPSQQVVTATLAKLPAAIADAQVAPPSLILIGDCIGLRDQLNWFERQPLFGQRIAICRAEHQCEAVADRVRALGGDPVVRPTIRIEPPADWAETDAAVADLSRFDWIAFTSANAVRAVCDRVLAGGRDARAFGTARIACIGDATAAALVPFGLRPDLVAAEPSAAGLAAEPALAGHIWFPAADRASETLATELDAAGARVTQTTVYRSVDVDDWPDQSPVDWIALSSSAIARGVGRLLKDRQTPCAAISEAVADVARTAGLHVAATAATSTWDGLLDAIAAATPPAAG